MTPPCATDRPKTMPPLPYSLRIVLENLTRPRAAPRDPEDDALAERIRNWRPGADPLIVPLQVDRVVLPDSSGLPVLLDFAALRHALAAAGRDTARAEPQIPCQLVVDHSLIVDQAGHPGAMQHNIAMEYRRNAERYAVFKWAQQAFSKLRIVPPGMGIIHQVHLEHLAQVVVADDGDADEGDTGTAHPEFVLGCDSHTPMVNALGVLGWGVGGIDAEAALIGERYRVVIPEVVGVRLTGTLPAGVTTTDLVLTLTQVLRAAHVVGSFVEFTGPGLDHLSVADRATLANMAPEYGATCGYFPIDDQTLAYLRQTGRRDAHVALVEETARRLDLFRKTSSPEPVFSRLVTLDLGRVEPSVAGPRRPQDRMALSQVGPAFRDALQKPVAEGGFGAARHYGHGRLAIAAITSCTNTSNPAAMLAAGLVARNAVRRGLVAASGVKTSLAPGSRVALTYLDRADLIAPMEALGFHAVGFGCTTCSGKSGPIDPAIQNAVTTEGMVAAAILSGNRNFEGRTHKAVQAAYLASPALVVAYALAGRIDIDFDRDPLGHDSTTGAPVFLRDLWPDPAELAGLAATAARPGDYIRTYADIWRGTPEWQDLQGPTGALFDWDPASSYIRRPPFFDADFLLERAARHDVLTGARALAVFGDTLTTDHVTPSGEITAETGAGRYLTGLGVPIASFNAYTQRRGNHEVMARATFANPRIRNLLVDRPGGFTRHLPDGPEMEIHQAAQAYRATATPILILAGRDYGMGSSRDWAAKGPALLGVSMIIAGNFERIHRSNLIGMGILPAVFAPGDSLQSLGLTGDESFDIRGLDQGIAAGAPIHVEARSADGRLTRFTIRADLHGADEARLLASGGIFPRLFNRLRHEDLPHDDSTEIPR